MAKKKLNTRFLILLGVVVIGLIGAGAVLFKLRNRIDPDEAVAQAKALMEKGDYKNAVEEFRGALGVRGTDPEVWVLAGDAYNFQAEADWENYLRAKGFYVRALEVDPRNRTALERMFEASRDEAEQRATPTSVENLATYSRRLSEVEPDNLEAKIGMHSATLLGYQIGGALESEDVDQAIQALDELTAQHPDRPEPRITALQARLMVADRLASANYNESKQRRQALVEPVEQLAEQFKDDAKVQATTYRLLAALGERDARDRKREVDAEIANRATPPTPAEMAAYNARIPSPLMPRAEALLARAVEKSDYEKDADVWVATRMMLAQFHLRRAGTDGTLSPEARQSLVQSGRTLFQEIIAKRPWDAMPRIQYAEALMDRDDFEAAEKLLAEALPAGPPRKGADALNAAQLKPARELTLLRTRLERLARDGTITPAQRAERVAALQKDYTRILEQYKVRADAPEVQRLWAGLQMQQNQFSEAINTLNTALQQAPANSDDLRTRRLRAELLLMLANANARLGNNARTEQVLRDLVAETRFPPAWKQLIRELINARKFDDAQRQLDAFVLAYADDPEVSDLRVQLASRQGATELEAVYSRLPESNATERLVKARQALASRRPADAVRLGRLVMQEEPANRTAIAFTVAGLADSGQRAEAIALLKETLAKDPQFPDGQRLLALISAETTDQQLQLIDDPYTRNLTAAELAIRDGRFDEAMNLLKEADKHPGGLRASELIFNQYAVQGKWQEAQPYLDKLTAANADQAGGRILRARFLGAQGKLDEAEALAREVSTADATRSLAGAHLALAQILHLRGEKTLDPFQRKEFLEKATASYDQVLSLKSTEMDAVMGIIRCMTLTGRAADAKRYIDRGRQLAPDNSELRQIELAWELEHGDPERILEPRRQLLQADRENQEHWLSLGVAFAGAAREMQLKASVGRAQGAAASQIRTFETKNVEYMTEASRIFREASAKFPNEIRFVSFYADIVRQLNQASAGEGAWKAYLSRPEQKANDEAVLEFVKFMGRLAPAGSAEHREAMRRAAPALQQFLAANEGPQTRVRIELAQLLEEDGKLPEALAALAAADHPDLRRERVEMLLRNRQPLDARKYADEMLASNPDADAWAVKAMVELTTDDRVAAARAVDEALKLDSTNPAALYYRSLLTLREPDPAKRNFQSAINDLNRVIQVRPGNLEPRLLLAEAHSLRGDPAAAMATLEAILAEVNPSHLPTVLRLADMYRATPPFDYRKALEMLRKVRAVPGYADHPDLLYAEAVTMLDDGRVADAEQKVQAALEKNGTSIPILQLFLQVKQRQGKYDEVLRAVEAALPRNPSAAWLHVARGKALAAKKDRINASAAFAKGFELAQADPQGGYARLVISELSMALGADAAAGLLGDLPSRDIEWKLLLADLYRREGQIDRSGELVGQLLADRGKLTTVQLLLSLRMASEIEQLRSPPDFEKAVGFLRESLSMRPEDVGVLNNLAYLLIHPQMPPGREKEAMEFASRAYQIMARTEGSAVNPLITDTYAWTLIRNDRVDEGVRLLEEALGRLEFSEGWLHLAEGYMRKRAFPQAQSALTRASELLDDEQERAQKQGVQDAAADTNRAFLKTRIEDATGRLRALEAGANAGGGN